MINTADVTKYAISKSFKVRITISLPESTTSSTNAVWLFGLTVKHKCADNTLTIATNLGYTIYYIDYPNADSSNLTGNQVITPNVNKSIPIADCPLTCSLEMWDKT